MKESEQRVAGRAAADAANSDAVSRDRALRVLALGVLTAVIARLLVGGSVFEQIWIGLSVVVFGVILLMAAGIVGLWICFGEAKVCAWLSPAHRSKQDVAFICCALISAAHCYYFTFGLFTQPS